jgi:hypothetical protein
MSLRQAINDMCRGCIYDSKAPGNWRQQTSACTSHECPLWPFRPRSTTSQVERAVSTQKAANLAVDVTAHEVGG